VNYFQPSFKLKSKARDGAKVTKKYHAPATPHERLLADERVTGECKERLRRTFSILDPVLLLSQLVRRNEAWLSRKSGAKRRSRLKQVKI
jgi:hypothetical protein